MYRYEDIAKKRLTIFNISGEEALALCPFHEDSNPSFRFNLRRGVFICYSCGAKGGIGKFLKHFGAVYIEPPVSLEVLNLQVAFMEMKVNQPAPYGRKFLPEPSLQRFAFPHDAWAQRGFDGPTVASWGLGYDPISDRLTLPLRDLYGRLLGVAFRRLDKTKHGKYVYPKSFPKKKNMFGSWKVRKPRAQTVALMEGPTDVIRAWQAGVPALGIYGSYFSDDHLILLHKLNIKRVVCFYDNDVSGRKALASTKEVIDGMLISSVDYANLPEGADPGSLPLETIRELYESA